MTQHLHHPVKHKHTLRQLISPARLLESLALQRPASLRTAWLVGLQAGLAVVAAALLLHYSPWPQWVAFGSLGALSALYGRFSSQRQRRRIIGHAGALLVSSVWVLSAVSLMAISTMSTLILFSIVAGAIAAWDHRAQLGLPGIVIFIFAGSAALSPAANWQEVSGRALATALGVGMALLAGWITERWRGSGAADKAQASSKIAPASAILSPTSASAPLVSSGANLAQPRLWQKLPAMRISLRVMLSCFVSAMLAHALGLAHPAWAAIGAVAVIQGMHLHIAMHRAWQRTLGSLVGSGLAWLILSEHPSFFQILLVVALLQLVTEMLMAYNYGLGQMAVTPMALLMTALASTTDAANMSSARIYDTALGAIVGIGLALVFSNIEERQHLAAHHHQR